MNLFMTCKIGITIRNTYAIPSNKLKYFCNEKQILFK